MAAYPTSSGLFRCCKPVCPTLFSVEKLVKNFHNSSNPYLWRRKRNKQTVGSAWRFIQHFNCRTRIPSTFWNLFYFVLWSTNAQLIHKLSQSYMFRHYRTILRELVISTLPSYTLHLRFKLCYQELHLKYLCNLARYWLQVHWGWHNSVETCRSVIICEIILHLLVIVQNNKRCKLHLLK